MFSGDNKKDPNESYSQPVPKSTMPENKSNSVPKLSIETFLELDNSNYANIEEVKRIAYLQSVVCETDVEYYLGAKNHNLDIDTSPEGIIKSDDLITFNDCKF